MKWSEIAFAHDLPTPESRKSGYTTHFLAVNQGLSVGTCWVINQLTTMSHHPSDVCTSSLIQHSDSLNHHESNQFLTIIDHYEPSLSITLAMVNHQLLTIIKHNMPHVGGPLWKIWVNQPSQILEKVNKWQSNHQHGSRFLVEPLLLVTIHYQPLEIQINKT